MKPPSHRPRKLALVLSGGGARGAYEAGIIHYIRTQLPGGLAERKFDILCGSSVGALTTAVLAGWSHDVHRQDRELMKLWTEFREHNVYRRDTMALLNILSSGGRGLVMNLLRELLGQGPYMKGFLDTSPLLPYLRKIIPWRRISKNIRDGFLDAVSVVTTNVATGRMEIFLEKKKTLRYTGDHLVHDVTLGPLHVAASAAIPILFPSVPIRGVSYTDGALHLNAPISPALHLGADAILVIGLHHRAKSSDEAPYHGTKGQDASLSQVLGRVMNTFLFSRVEYDVQQVEKINLLLELSETLYGKTYLRDLSQLLKGRKNTRSSIHHEFRKLPILRIRPSEDIMKIFGRHYHKHGPGHMTNFEKFFVRTLNMDPSQGNELLTYLSMIPAYIKDLLDLGFEDARSHHNELKEFLQQ